MENLENEVKILSKHKRRVYYGFVSCSYCNNVVLMLCKKASLCSNKVNENVSGLYILKNSTQPITLITVLEWELRLICVCIVLSVSIKPFNIKMSLQKIVYGPLTTSSSSYL